MPDREELDDPQNPNHPAVTPHRVDAPDDPANDPNAQSRKIHDDEIAQMKRDQNDEVNPQVNGPDDRSETGSPSDGVSANEGKVVGGGAPTN